jgi:hypothetical protein
MYAPQDGVDIGAIVAGAHFVTFNAQLGQDAL